MEFRNIVGNVASSLQNSSAGVGAIRISLFLFFLLRAALPSHAFADPVTDAQRLVNNAKSDPPGNARRLVEIILANPSEPVLLAAARWPWGDGDLGNSPYELRRALKPWVARSPELRSHFRKLLQQPGKRETAFEMLKDVVATEPGLHEEIRELAKNGSDQALSALAPFVASDAEDRRLLLRAAEGPGGAENYRIAYALAENLDVPEVRAFYLRRLRETRSTEVLEEYLKNAGHFAVRDPEMLAIVRAAMRRPSSPENFEIIETSLGLILNNFPADAEALGVLKSHLQAVCRSFEKIDSGVPNIFKIASSYVGRTPGLEHIVERGMDDVLRAIRRGEGYIQDLALAQFTDLYITYLREHRRPDAGRLGELLAAVDPDAKEYVANEILLGADRLPRGSENLVREAARHTTARSLSSNMLDHEPVSEAMLEVARRDLGGSEDTFGGALRIFERAAASDPAALETLRGLVTHSDPRRRSLVRDVLRGLDPSLPEAQTNVAGTTEKGISERAARQRKLLFSRQPPSGWKQVVQSHSVNFWNDPFLFNDEVNGQTRGIVDTGIASRKKALAEAQGELESEGLETHPVGWVLRKYEEREKQVTKHFSEMKLSPEQVIRIENEAMNRVRAQYPSVRPSDLSQPPYDRLYQRHILELETGARRKDKSAERILEEMASEGWRQSTLKDLQQSFRKGLLAIVKSNQGAIIATEARKRENLGRDSLAIREEDIGEIRLLPNPASPPYNVNIEWRGKVYSLTFVGKSLDGIEGLETYHLAAAGETAALTLGSHAASRKDLAREVYLTRAFELWIHQYQLASTTVQDESGRRMGEELRRHKTMEDTRHESATSLKGPDRVLSSILWAPIEINPNHWRDREARALSTGKSGWSVVIADHGGTQSRQTAQAWANIESTLEEPAKPDRRVEGVPQFQEPWNKEITDEMRKSVLYRIESTAKGDASQTPRSYVEDFAHDLPTTDKFQKVEQVPYSLGKSELVLHTERLAQVGNGGLVSLPLPVERQRAYVLSGLQIFGGDGARLYPGRDFEIVRNPETGNFFARLRNPRISAVRFSAGYAPGGMVPRSPEITLDRERVRALSEKLREAGFEKIHEEIMNALAHPGDPSATELGNIFRTASTYASSFETDLGERAAEVPADNPFRSFSRFATGSGILCAQCDGSNELFSRFLQLSLDGNSGVRARTRPALVRFGNESILSVAGLHQISALLVPGAAYPIHIDVTPSRSTNSDADASEWGSAENTNVSPAPGFRFTRVLSGVTKWLGSWRRKNKEGTSPPWTDQVRDQVPEPPVTFSMQLHFSHPLDDKDSIATLETRRRIKEAYDALEKAATAGQSHGTVPRAPAWSRSEPLARAAENAGIALDLLGHEIELETLRTRMRALDSTLDSEKLNGQTRSELLAELARIAEQDRAYLEKFLETSSKRFPHYRNPLILDPVRLLFQEIYEIRVHTESLCATVLSAAGN